MVSTCRYLPKVPIKMLRWTTYTKHDQTHRCRTALRRRDRSWGTDYYLMQLASA
ncbi:uncharacterized protein PgNI_04824 [Pyricularia grisea]|uniref:Uncharacterized protein n=1 Tax=Pyricularia grisea TaxID=148305 RepID=A0A6P8BDR4_PYRGI|nr:uncharacterized protein PgNI_04824 [Pyricularia grisea]TLD13822.1 hypothetical protein PgNI_04824 [Pyricularia grisea]